MGVLAEGCPPLQIDPCQEGLVDGVTSKITFIHPLSLTSYNFVVLHKLNMSNFWYINDEHW